MLRFISIFALSLLMAFPSNAGVAKWLGRGAVACAATPSCAGFVGRGLGQGAIKGGTAAIERYGPSLIARCLASPVCSKYLYSAGGVVAGGAGGALGTKLDLWMKENGESEEAKKEPLAPMFGHNSGNVPEDPDDPFGENKKDNKPVIGQKLDYIFGKATGRVHNIERSQSMLAQLNRIGINDSPASREYIEKNLVDAFNDPATTIKISPEGFITKESLLMGPGGGVKLESVWIDRRLISAILKGRMK